MVKSVKCTEKGGNGHYNVESNDTRAGLKRHSEKSESPPSIITKENDTLHRKSDGPRSKFRKNVKYDYTMGGDYETHPHIETRICRTKTPKDTCESCRK